MGKRAVMMSHHLWQQMMTQGWCVTKIECTVGLPEGAVLIGSFFTESVRFTDDTSETLEMVSDPVFLFEHPSWQEDGNEHTIVTPRGEKVSVLLPEFKQHYS